jgi:hypothetical protein
MQLKGSSRSLAKSYRRLSSSKLGVLLHLKNIRASLPTAQGLLVLYMASVSLSRDGAALIYRSLGYSMVDRLRPEGEVLIRQYEEERIA